MFGEAQVDVAKTQIHTVSQVIDVATLRDGEPPNSLQDLIERKLLKESQLKDPWKQELMYSVPGRNDLPYDLCSKGPDKREGGDDDMCND